MNKNFLWTFMATLLLTACGSENETCSTDNPEVKISLVAPNGERISADMPSLNCEVATMVAKQFGNDYPFTITDIQYTDIEDGYLALIEYQLENGQKSNYAITNSKNILSEFSADCLNIDLSGIDIEISLGDNE